MNNALLIFIKNPALGKVKTRLAKSVGDYNALKIYQYLLDHTMEITYELDAADKFIYYNEFIPTKDEWPQDIFQKELQEGKNLAEKMNNAFKKAFDAGYKHVVLMMPDCPKMSDTLLEKAFKALTEYDFVFGPTKDGGYYLIGMSYYLPQLFQNKEYSTPTVLSEALNEITSKKQSYLKLTELTDVDMEEDLGKLSKMIIDKPARGSGSGEPLVSA